MEVLPSVPTFRLSACRLLHCQGAIPRASQRGEVKFYLLRFLPPHMRAALWITCVLPSGVSPFFLTLLKQEFLFSVEFRDFRLFVLFSPLSRLPLLFCLCG